MSGKMQGGTSLGRVRGLGSAKHGSHHWLMQRITALGNVVLGIWLIEDYVHGEAARLVALVALNFFVFAGAAYGIFAVLRVALAGTTGA